MALAPTALAAPPAHPRTPALDVSGLSKACGAAVDSAGDLYAASPGEGKIEVYSPADHETPIAEIANSHEPCALAVDSRGDLFVLQSEGHAVVRYVPDSYPFAGAPSYGEAEAIDASGEARGIAVDTGELWTSANLAIGGDDTLFVAKGDRVEARGNEAQRVQVSGSGTYKLIHDGEETTPLPANASHAEVQAALEALAGIGAGNVAVTATESGATDHRIAFTHALGLTDVERIEIDTSGLSGSAQTALLAQGGLGTDEEQRIELENATGGSFKLKFGGQETEPIAWDAKAPKIQEALEGLANIEAGDVAVRTEPSGFARIFSLAFRGAYAATDVPQIETASALSPNEVQQVTVSATAGKYKLTFREQTTGAIDFNAPAAEVKAALNALATIGGVGGSVSVTGGPGDEKGTSPYLVTFEGALAGTNVPALQRDQSLLTGTVSVSTLTQGPNLRVSTIAQGWSGRIGEGELTEASGVAAYTHSIDEGRSDRYLFAADAASDRVEVFGGRSLATLKPRTPIDGPGEGFGFGAAGAYLAADPGNALQEKTLKCAEPVNGQACTAGHLLLYDAAHDAVREYDAAGHPLDSFAAAGLADAEPSALAIDRSGGAGEGTIYVGSGAGAGARLLAFGPLGAPSRKPLPALSQTLAGAAAVATDSHGDVYVAAGSTVHVYGPDGKEIALGKSFGLEKPTNEALAVDSAGRVYVICPTATEKRVCYSTPSAYPPKAGTTYSGTTIVATKASLGFEPRTFASDPGTDNLFITGEGKTAVLSPPEEGSKIIVPCFACGLLEASRSIAVGPGHEFYAAMKSPKESPGAIDPSGAEVWARASGAGCPLGAGLFNAALASDLGNGHILAFNSTRKTAEEYDASGACVAAFGSFTPLAKPESIAVDNACELHEPPLDETTTPTCEEFDPANGTVYVAFDDTAIGSFDVVAFGPLEYPEVEPLPEFLLTVSKEGSGTGTVTSSPVGIDCGATCSAQYEEGLKVTLSAEADPGSEFSGWSGCDSEPEGKCRVTMSEAREVTATFDKEEPPGVKLTVALEGTGSGTVTSNPGLISCGVFCEDEYPEGAEVTLTASPSPGSLFMAWKHCDKGGIEGRQCTVTMSEAKEVSALFITAHDLTLAKAEGSGPGKLQSKPAGIVCLYACTSATAAFKEGTPVTVEPTAAKHFHLAEWGGDCEGEGACELTMGEDHEVSARFEEDPKLTLKLSKAGSGQGIVKSHPAGVLCSYTCSTLTASFYEGEEVLLEVAKAGKGSTFAGWSGGGCSGTGACTVTIDGAKEVAAEFE